MKKYLILPLLACSMLTMNAEAQNNKEGLDVKPLISVQNNDIEFTAGGRIGVDAAYYGTEYTPMSSGYKLTDARINTSLSYGENWYMFAEVDFSSGAVSQKNIFVKYTNGDHSIKLGYYCEAAGMSLNTSSYSYHFISRASSANTFAPSRALGISYKFVNDKWFLNQGLAAENQYNNQDFGFQGGSISGRWLFKPINDKSSTLHLGVSARYAKYNTGEYVDGVMENTITVSSALETNVDKTTQYLNDEIDWVDNETLLSVEALYRKDRFFVRGEYMYQIIGKDRDDQRLFENQLGGLWSASTLESWQSWYPLQSSKFSGGYVEAGFLIRGDRYKYDNNNAVIKGNTGKGDLEIVARYNRTNLNDIADSDYYFIGLDTFYTGGEVSDFAGSSTSIAGGCLNSYTLGINYTINEHVQCLASYTYNKISNVRLPMDTKINMLQARIVVAF
ncbi:MAG: porin [Rikenellaceae bacterium]